MPSEFVWRSYGRFIHWSERLWQPPITFETRRKTFHHYSEQLAAPSLKNFKTQDFQRRLLAFVPWVGGSLMVACTGALTLLLLLTNAFAPRERLRGNLSLLETVFSILYMSLTGLTLVLLHLSIKLGARVVETLNQLLHLDWTMNKWGFLDKKGLDSVGLFMLCFLILSNTIPIALSIFGVYENLDVIHFFLRKFMKTNTGGGGRYILLLLLRFLWELITILEVWKQIGFFSLTSLLALQIVSKALAVKTKPIQALLRNAAGRRKAGARARAATTTTPLCRLQLQWSFNQAYKLYRRLQLIIYAGVNPCLTFFIPNFMALGLILCILCDFTTIKLSSEVWRSGLLIVMPSVSFCVKFIILTLLPQAVAVHEESLALIRGWKGVAQAGNPLSRRKCRALMPLRIYAGSFFYFQKSTKTTYISVMLYYTVTAVISIKREAAPAV